MAMSADPFTLVVALNEGGEAEGELYVDDGRSYDFKSGRYVVLRFKFINNRLAISTVGGGGGAKFSGSEAVIERVVILGYGTSVPSAVILNDRDVDFVLNEGTGVLALQRLDVVVGLEHDVVIDVRT